MGTRFSSVITMLFTKNVLVCGLLCLNVPAAFASFVAMDPPKDPAKIVIKCDHKDCENQVMLSELPEGWKITHVDPNGGPFDMKYRNEDTNESADSFDRPIYHFAAVLDPRDENQKFTRKSWSRFYDGDDDDELSELKFKCHEHGTPNQIDPKGVCRRLSLSIAPCVTECVTYLAKSKKDGKVTGRFPMCRTCEAG